MNSSRYFKLGLFVLIGVGMLVGAILALGAGRLLEKRISAETVMDESISGLDVGSPVKYRGVTIGEVTSITFAADRDGGSQPKSDRLARYVLIEMSLDATAFKGMTPLEIRETLERMARNGLRARIDQQGIGGGVYVGLDFGPPGSSPPIEDRRASPTLYIPSAPSTMTQVMSAAEQLASDLRHANLPVVVEHIDTLVTSAAAAAQHLNQIVAAHRPAIDASLSDLPAITGHLKTTAARLDEILHDQRVDRTLGNVADDSAKAGATIDDVRHAAREARTIISTQQQDIAAIIADLRRTAENLAALSSDARENPSRLLFGGPPARKEPGQ